ncbi:MAG: hypothetical protein ACAI44_18200 [Candidatus Sericytochromatia bacterium]
MPPVDAQPQHQGGLSVQDGLRMFLAVIHSGSFHTEHTGKISCAHAQGLAGPFRFFPSNQFIDNQFFKHISLGIFFKLLDIKRFLAPLTKPVILEDTIRIMPKRLLNQTEAFVRSSQCLNTYFRITESRMLWKPLIQGNPIIQANTLSGMIDEYWIQESGTG